jgi:hypothetical protein
MTTRTHTVYFDGDKLSELRTALDDISADWHARARYIDEGVRLAGERRIAVAEAAYELLREPVADGLR